MIDSEGFIVPRSQQSGAPSLAPLSPSGVSPAGPPGRDFADPVATRKAIFDNVLAAASQVQPVSNSRYTLRLSGVKYLDPEDVPLKRQRVATLTGETIGRRLEGTWELVDNESGNVVQARKQLLARVPYMTGRGTFIRKGNDYVLCLHSSVKVWTERGMIPIGEIVNSRLAVRVWSYDFDRQEFVLKPVTGWFRNPVDGLGCARFSQLCRMPVEAPFFHTSTLWSTPEHEILSSDGSKVPIANASSLLMVEEELSYTQEQLLYGSLLGDAHVRDDGIYQGLHGQAQRSYVSFKKDVFGPLVHGDIKDLLVDSYWRSQFVTRAHPAFWRARRLCYPNGVKTISWDWLNRVDAMGLGIWYGDDGAATYTNHSNHFTVGLFTNGFSKECVDTLRSWLQDRWGFATYTTRDSRYSGRDLGWVIRISGESAHHFLDLVAPYLHPSLHYKLLPRPRVSLCGCGREINPVREFCNACLLEECRHISGSLSKTARYRFGSARIIRRLLSAGLVPSERTVADRWEDRKSIAGSLVSSMLDDTTLGLTLVETPFSYEAGRGRIYERCKYAYDICVEDTHNYVANGVLVGNSNQQRLKPGIYTRFRENDEIEAHVNTLPLKGFAHRYFLDPAKGVFYLRVGQAKIPLMPLMKLLGATDEQLKEAWGELYETNQAQNTANNTKKLLERFLR